MIDLTTFLTALYVMVDDYLKTLGPQPKRRGPRPSLAISEVVTLAIVARWGTFVSERAFYRFALEHLRSAFPTLPAYSQFNRRTRAAERLLALVATALGDALRTCDDVYEVVDTFGVVTRDRVRYGAGWLAGQADIGWCRRLGWFEGVRVLLSVTRSGAITGFGSGAASTSERLMAETLFAARHTPQPGLECVGRPTKATYVTDTGFEGKRWHQVWLALYWAVVVCPNKRSARAPWPEAARRWLSGIRQIVETTNGCLLNAFGLARERPHTLDGLRARLAARVALHNASMWINRALGRAPLAFADLIAW